jgi:hypothetical protein
MASLRSLSDHQRTKPRMKMKRAGSCLARR